MQVQYEASVRAGWQDITGEVLEAPDRGAVMQTMSYAVGETAMERQVLEVIYGHLRALAWYSQKLSEYWMSLLGTGMQEEYCC